MKLYSRDFVATLKRAARTRIRSSKALRRKYNLRRRRLGNLSVRNGVRYTFLLLVALSVIYKLSRSRPELPFVVIALYSTGIVVFRTWKFFNSLHGPDELAIFFGLPITDDDFFRLQWKKFLLRSLWFFAFAFLLYLIVALETPEPWLLRLAVSVLAAFAQWVLLVSMSLLVLNVRHPWLPRVSVGLYAIGIACIYAPPWVSTTAAAFTVVLPAGWINRVYIGLLRGNLFPVFWLLPAVAFVVVGFAKLPRLRQTYAPKFFEHAGFAEPSEVLGVVTEGVAMTEDQMAEQEGEIEGASGPEAMREAASRLAAGGLNWELDWNALWWIERVAGRWLSSEQKPVANFMLGAHLGRWSSGWGKSFYVTLITIVAALFVPALPTWTLIAAAAIAGFMAAPVLGGNWPGFSPVRISMKQSFVAAFYPVSYWQVSRIILKVNFVRLLAYFVLLFPTVLVLCWRAGETLSQGVSTAIGVWGWLAALQFAAIVVLHSRGTNDTRTFSFGTMAFFLCAIPVIVLLLIGAFVLFLPEAPYGGVVSALMVAPLLVLAWWLYGLLYNHGRIDFTRDPDL